MTAIMEEGNRLLPRIVLIACGSFSPPTPMHFRMFEIARDYFEMAGTHQIVGGIVSPVHDSYGKKGLASGTHRCAMVKLALKNSNWIRMSDWEINQSQWKRTRQVLQYHQNFINNYMNSPKDLDLNHHVPGWLPNSLRERNGRVQLKLLCGADLLESFAVPGLWADEDIEDIVRNHGLVVITRNGSNPEKFIFDSDILTKYQRHITLITNWVPNEVSSTMIRRLLSRGQSVKYLIDDAVLDYIKKTGIFNSNTKYLTDLVRPTTNNINPEYIKHENMSITPSDDITSPDNNNDSSFNDDEDNMNDTDYSIKKIWISCDLGNTKSKVFCCGENDDKLPGKLLPQRNRPGQAVQVSVSERGCIERVTDSEELRQPKKMRTNV